MTRGGIANAVNMGGQMGSRQELEANGHVPGAERPERGMTPVMVVTGVVASWRYR